MPFKLYKEHPLLCGLLLFDSSVALQEAGLRDANHYPCLRAAGLRSYQDKAPLRKWVDLEHILSLRGDGGQIFLGSPPETLNRFIGHWAIVKGVSVAFSSQDNVARLARDPSSFSQRLLAAQTQKRRMLLSPTPLSLKFDNFRGANVHIKRRFGVLQSKVTTLWHSTSDQL